MCSMLNYSKCCYFVGYKCTEEGCNEKFSKWSLLRKHVADDHVSGMLIAVKVHFITQIIIVVSRGIIIFIRITGLKLLRESKNQFL